MFFSFKKLLPSSGNPPPAHPSISNPNFPNPLRISIMEDSSVPCTKQEKLSLNDFHILEELFRSATGAVFKVRRKNNRKLCVLKERKFAELGRKRDILNEVDLLERLDHPNVIKCYGHFWDYSSGALFMVLEYADAGDLYSAVLRRRKDAHFWPEEEIWKVSERALRKTRILATNPAKWLQTAASTTELTLFHSILIRLARSPPPCFIKNAHNLASLGAEFLPTLPGFEPPPFQRRHPP